MGIYYQNEQHREKFISLLEKYYKINSEHEKIDSEYLSAFYLFSSPLLSPKELEKYVNNSGFGISFPKMLKKEVFSTSEEVMVKVARNLFDWGGVVKPMEMVAYLGDENFKLAVQAMEFRRNPPYTYEL